MCWDVIFDFILFQVWIAHSPVHDEIGREILFDQSHILWRLVQFQGLHDLPIGYLTVHDDVSDLRGQFSGPCGAILDGLGYSQSPWWSDIVRWEEIED